VAVDAPGRLAAMMLDTKRTFDRLVETHAPNPRVRDAIFANNYYQQLSSSLGGSRELIAMERVLEAAGTGDYDLLVVDTPPSQHALDFLDAPKRLLELIDGSLTGMLVRPYSLAARAQFNLFRQSSAAALKFLERLTGVEMLADLSDFLLAFSSMFDGFKERSHRVMALMGEPTTAFLLVCAPDPASVSQVDQFVVRLQQERLQVAGILANRVHQPAPDAAAVSRVAPLLDRLPDARMGGWSLGDRVRAVCEEARQLAAADHEMLQSLADRGLPLRTVPHFNRDLHSMTDLADFAGSLHDGSEIGPQRGSQLP
jgi:anion-transporting  ArsA/GET3 family ATPase